MVTSNAESASSIPGRGNKVPCATWLKNKQTKTQDLQNSQFQATHVMCSCPVPSQISQHCHFNSVGKPGRGSFGHLVSPSPRLFPSFAKLLSRILVALAPGAVCQGTGFPHILFNVMLPLPLLTNGISLLRTFSEAQICFYSFPA